MSQKREPQPPHSSRKVELPEEERRRRQAVFARAPRTVLVKTYAAGPMEELELRSRDSGAVEAAQDAENVRKGRDSHAYRQDRPDNGFAVMQKEQLVQVSDLIGELLEAGYVFTGGHRYVDADRKEGGVVVRKGKGDINVLSFDQPREGVLAQPLPDSVRSFLSGTWNNVSVWCNLKSPEGEPSYRLDTVNVAKAADPEFATKAVLHRHGNSYRLEPVSAE